MGLRLMIRRHQFYKDSQPVTINCLGNNQAEWVSGTVDSTWVDITDDTAGLDKFQLAYTSDDSTQKASNKGASYNIDIVGSAASLLDEWLFNTPCSYVNYFDAKIVDEECGITYKYYELKPDNIEFCGNEGCGYSLPLREVDNKYDALKRLSIHDNWQKWFSEDGNKDHPTFQVAVLDITGGVGNSMNIGNLLFADSFPVTKILRYIPGVKNWVKGLKFTDEIKVALGLGNFAPSPKIYTILENAAIKLGIGVDSPFNPGKELHNDCLFVPYGGNYHTNTDDGNNPSSSTKHIYGNRYIWSMTEFLDELSKLYALTWDLQGGDLVIKFKKDVYAQDPMVTVDGSDDCNTPLSVCYEFGLTKKAGYGRYEYSTDGADFASNHVQLPYNDIVDYDGATENPMLEGSVDKRLQFASTAFLNDGFGSDGNALKRAINSAQLYASILLFTILASAAGQLAGVLTATGGAAMLAIFFAWLAFINGTAGALKKLYSNNAALYGIVRLKGGGEVSVPRVLRWDATTPMNDARVVKTNTQTIQINSKFNYESIGYRQQFDKYTSSIHKTIDVVYNYPLYFDSWYFGNLYDMYHNVVDNPMVVNEGHKIVTVTLPMSCDVIKDAGLGIDSVTSVGNIAYIATEGIYLRITEVMVNYGDRSITIKGKIINR